MLPRSSGPLSQNDIVSLCQTGTKTLIVGASKVLLFAVKIPGAMLLGVFDGLGEVTLGKRLNSRKNRGTTEHNKHSKTLSDYKESHTGKLSSHSKESHKPTTLHLITEGMQPLPLKRWSSQDKPGCAKAGFSSVDPPSKPNHPGDIPADSSGPGQSQDLSTQVADVPCADDESAIPVDASELGSIGKASTGENNEEGQGVKSSLSSVPQAGLLGDLL